MHVAFRTDCSVQIGTGHVMRCLTLADALRHHGVQCTFVSRPHPGHLLDLIHLHGHNVIALSQPKADLISLAGPAHSAWLGAEWDDDADETLNALRGGPIDWLVADHYVLDMQWEKALRPLCRKIMVIDDLADRPHDCDLLLDQNLGRSESDYANLLNSDTELLIGPKYALLRPEFAQWRKFSLTRREAPNLRNLLISMGGVDKGNATGHALEVLMGCALPEDLQITVVMGPHAPWLAHVQAQSVNMPWPTKVLVGVSNMAQIMADSDLAIGAAGATAWERCSLGLPTLVLVLAENQYGGAKAMQSHRACKVLNNMQELIAAIDALYANQVCKDELKELSRNSAKLTDGQGTSRVVTRMLS